MSPTTWNGDPITEADIAERLKKPARGEFLIERKETRRAIDQAEDAIKDEVRARDRRCRWPHCEVCRRFKDIALEVAHVLGAKGMSSDRTLERSQRNRMMLLDKATHGQQEQHRKWIEPIDPVLGTDGPCEFWMEDENKQPFLVAREIAPFILERD